MINKKFIHFEHFDVFNAKFLSADKDNTTYTVGVGGEIVTGEPEISYQSIVYIKDKGFFFTHGKLYDASGMADKLKAAVKINGTDFDGSEDITTETWGTTRNIKIVDSTEDNDGGDIAVDGSGDIILKLPTKIVANVKYDYDGRDIVDTYTTHKELQDALDEIPSFLVYSGEDDADPELSTSPASLWTTTELKEQHAGDYYITVTGRIFQFIEDPSNGWKWKELTDVYLYDCLQKTNELSGDVDNFEDRLDEMEDVVNPSSWSGTQSTVETGDIFIKGISTEAQPYLDVILCPQSVSYRLASDSSIYLPFIYGTTWTRTRTTFQETESRLITTSDLARITGKIITIKNTSDSTGNITLMVGNNQSGNDQEIVLAPGKVCVLKLVATVDTGVLYYSWEPTTAANLGVSW